jgi:hypothetical protein
LGDVVAPPFYCLHMQRQLLKPFLLFPNRTHSAQFFDG